MKPEQGPHSISLGVTFKFSNEHSLPIHMGAPPGFFSGSEGVMERNRPTTTTKKIIFSHLKLNQLKVVL